MQPAAATQGGAGQELLKAFLDSTVAAITHTPHHSHHSHSSPLTLLTTHTLHPVQASKPEDGLKCSECNQALPVAVVMNSLTLTIKAYMRQYYAVSVCVSVCECV